MTHVLLQLCPPGLSLGPPRTTLCTRSAVLLVKPCAQAAAKHPLRALRRGPSPCAVTLALHCVFSLLSYWAMVLLLFCPSPIVLSRFFYVRPAEARPFQPFRLRAGCSRASSFRNDFPFCRRAGRVGCCARHPIPARGVHRAVLVHAFVRLQLRSRRSLSFRDTVA